MSLVHEFCKEYLNGDLSKLRWFSFGQLARIPRQFDYAKYGASISGRFDCDDCKLMRDVYEQIWGVESPDCRGDTICSFRTVFGREYGEGNKTKLRDDQIKGFASFKGRDLPRTLIRKAWDFHDTYHTIGNFLPLPDKKVDGKSLNTYRYRQGVRNDDFGSFLEAVRMYLCGEGMACGRAELPELFIRLMDENSFFWDRYRGADGFRRYVADFFLEDFVGPDGRGFPRKIVSWNDKRVPDDEFVKAAFDYVSSSSEMIYHRATRMLDALSRGERAGSKDDTRFNEMWVRRFGANLIPTRAGMEQACRVQKIAGSPMLETLIAETRRALDAKLYHVAILSALTLPDVCSCVESPELRDNIAERYIRWCDDNLDCCRDRPGKENGVPNVSGEAIYNLRNNLLHRGSAAVDQTKFKRDDTNYLNHLVLMAGVCEGLQVAANIDFPEYMGIKARKAIITTVEALVHSICDAAEICYREHRAEFDGGLSPILDFSKFDEMT